MKKYELTDESKSGSGITVYRIRAVRDIVLSCGSEVHKGDLGGWVQGEDNLSQEEASWIQQNAAVYGEAWVGGDACVSGNALVFGNAQVYGEARVYGHAKVGGNAHVHCAATVCGNALVCGDARVYGHAKVGGNAWVSGKAWVFDEAMVFGSALVCDEAQVGGVARVFGDARVDGNMHVTSTEQGCAGEQMSSKVQTPVELENTTMSDEHGREQEACPCDETLLRKGLSKEAVNHPSHYQDPSGVECITIVRHRNFDIGNAIKYLWRAGLKSEEGKSDIDKQIEDLRKAIWYIEDEIKTLEERKANERKANG